MNKQWLSVEDRVTAYLHHRRQLGYCLEIEGAQLHRFAQFAERQGHRGSLTLGIACAWANASCSPLGAARRLEVIRPFTKYCQCFEPETIVPPADLFGRGHRRLPPHIYTDEEVQALLDGSKELAPRGGLRPATIHTFIGLLAATGLRVSEALSLDRRDVDLETGLITVRDGKFGKSRALPLHCSTIAALASYRHLRDRRLAVIEDTAFFVCDDASRLSYDQALYAFQCLRRQLGWQRNSTGRQPRLYDLRHTFACRCLQRWYAQGVDVNWALPQLSTYLGHVKVTDTYWYLTAVPDLMAIVAKRFERFTQGDQAHG